MLLAAFGWGSCRLPPHVHTRHVPRARLADGAPGTSFTVFFGLGCSQVLLAALGGWSCHLPPHPHTRHVPRARLADGTPAVSSYNRLLCCSVPKVNIRTWSSRTLAHLVCRKQSLGAESVICAFQQGCCCVRRSSSFCGTATRAATWRQFPANSEAG